MLAFYLLCSSVAFGSATAVTATIGDDFDKAEISTVFSSMSAVPKAANCVHVLEGTVNCQLSRVPFLERSTVVSFIKHVRRGEVEPVRQFLAANPHQDPANIKNPEGTQYLGTGTERNFSVLQYAASRGQVEIVSLLLEAGANPNYVDEVGHTALFMACLAKTEYVSAVRRAETVKTILRHSENRLLRLADKRGLTPLYGSCFAGYEEIVQLLLNAGAHKLDGITIDEFVVDEAIRKAELGKHANIVRLLQLEKKKLEKREDEE